MHKLSRRNAICLALLAGAAPFVASLPSAAQEKVSLAIKGYDPVAYFTDGKPTRGLPEIEYQWDERRWLFSSAAHRELFKADPVRYAPQFGNYCAMALAKGEIVVADPENWLINEGKLYVFGKPAPAGPGLFQKDLAANIAKADQNRPILPER
jgi:hypothetical protein